MNLIPTTATAVEKLKSSAKAIKKAERISHTAALERAAQSAGYDHWHHVQWCLAQHEGSGKTSPDNAAPVNRFDSLMAKGQAYMDYLARKAVEPVRVNEPKGDVFHDVVIDGTRFYAQFSVEGPIVLKIRPGTRNQQDGWVQLGVASIHCAPMDEWDDESPQRWSVCKYGPREARIDLAELSEEGRHAFAREFGIAIVYPNEKGGDETPPDAEFNPVNRNDLFYFSPAFAALCQWANKHPRKIRQLSGFAHLGDWVEAAIAGKAPWLLPPTQLDDDEDSIEEEDNTMNAFTHIDQMPTPSVAVFCDECGWSGQSNQVKHMAGDVICPEGHAAVYFVDDSKESGLDL